MPEASPRTIRLADYRAPDFAIDEVALRFDLDEAATRVHSRLAIRRTGHGAAPLVLDGQDLRLVSIALDGAPLPARGYEVAAETLTVAQVPDAFTLEIETEIAPATNTALEGLYVSSGNFVTQCEAEGFRRITYFLDRPDAMSVFTTEVVGDRTRLPVLLSNGNRVATDDLGDGRHMARWHDPHPKPAYLFALVAGDLACVEDAFTTASGRQVTLRIYVEHGNEGRCAFAMDALKRSMAWDEARYGREYDLDVFMVVAVGDFNMGAMENKGLNVFNAKYVLADPETATDADYTNIEAIIAHEYFHNWTGNRVTCRDWFQLSLKEGLTVFRDQQFSADVRSGPVKRIADVRLLRARQFPEDAGPLAHPVQPQSYIEINNFYTATVYEKGAEVVRMIHTLLGDEAFRRGTDLYFERHDGQAVTIEEFVAAMEAASDRDLGQFRHWYWQAGTPRLAARGRYDAAAGTYDLTLTQSCGPTPGQATKKPMVVPVAMGLLGPDGEDLPLRLEGEDDAPTQRVLALCEAERTFRFRDVAAPPVPSLLRGFSAPVTLALALSADERAFLMAHDSDPFNRWEAANQFAVELLLDMVADVQAGRTLAVDDRYVDAVGAVLADDSLDQGLVAEMLTLPAEEYLGNQMDVVDVDAVHTAREHLRRTLATRLECRFETIYRQNASNRAYAPTAAEAGRRRLRNTALAYLASRGTERAVDACSSQFANADNMTDSIAALQILADLDRPERALALDRFFQRWQRDPIVVDKWFALQAQSSLPGTLQSVRALLDHPAFTLRNPNRVRALIGAFASGNPVRFHAADGAGYDFLTDQVIALDALNPQVAARLLTPLGHWRKFDATRQASMKAALHRILYKPGDLSRDVYEIASKSLA